MNNKNKDNQILDSDEKFYLDFSIEGTVSSDEKEIDKLKEDLSNLISKVLKEKFLKSVTIRLSKFSEIELLVSEAINYSGEEFH